MSNPVPTCNEKVIAETVIETGESRKMVEAVTQHYSQFIADTIRAGGFESVRVPHFGIFKAKLLQMQWRSYMKAIPKTITRKK